mmetsp:Transcript_14307/g.45135  ORF Transcript_14307/g.45135 Transcript_14307/m.45135 type:complete len:242 (-) Transcript_14307:331-1056(-)
MVFYPVTSAKRVAKGRYDAGRGARKEKKRPSWNPYLTDGQRYKLSAAEEARRKREREKVREATKHRAQHRVHVKYNWAHRKSGGAAIKEEEHDASRLIIEAEPLEVARPKAKAKARAAPPRAAETVDSLSLRVWRLEDALDDAVATNAELSRRVSDLTALVADMRARLDDRALTPAKVAHEEPTVVVTPPPDPPQQPAPKDDDDLSVDLKWTLDAASRVYKADDDDAAKHVAWRPHTTRLW